jgi:hypothetical protein
LRAALGRRTDGKARDSSSFLLARDSGFEDGANALISADKNLNKGKYKRIIRNVFIRRGILPNTDCLPTFPLERPILHQSP